MPAKSNPGFTNLPCGIHKVTVSLMADELVFFSYLDFARPKVSNRRLLDYPAVFLLFINPNLITQIHRAVNFAR